MSKTNAAQSTVTTNNFKLQPSSESPKLNLNSLLESLSWEHIKICTPLYYSSFHVLFHYPYITPIIYPLKVAPTWSPTDAQAKSWRVKWKRLWNMKWTLGSYEAYIGKRRDKWTIKWQAKWGLKGLYASFPKQGDSSIDSKLP